MNQLPQLPVMHVPLEDSVRLFNFIRVKYDVMQPLKLLKIVLTRTRKNIHVDMYVRKYIRV